MRFCVYGSYAPVNYYRRTHHFVVLSFMYHDSILGVQSSHGEIFVMHGLAEGVFLTFLHLVS